MGKYKRKKVFIDPEVQGALIRQTIVQWACYFGATFAVLLLWQITISGGGFNQPFAAHVRQMMARYGPVFCVLTLLVPALAWDSVRLSHRFVGPLYRLRISLRKLAAGDDVPKLAFRKGDFWRDMADDFNAVRSRIVEQEEERPSPQPQSEPSPCERNLDPAAELCEEVC